MWDPIKSVESAVKDVKDTVSDTVQASHKLVDDVYNFGATVIKGGGKVGVDLVQTAAHAGTDLAAGNLEGAASDVGHGVVATTKDTVDAGKSIAIADLHGLKDLGKTAVKVGSDLNHFAIDGLNTVAPGMGTAVRVGQVFAEAAVNTAVLQPIDGITQLAGAGVHALTGYQLPKLNLNIRPDTNGLGLAGKIAEYAGDGVGFVAPLLLTGGATSALAGIAIAGAKVLKAWTGEINGSPDGLPTLDELVSDKRVTSANGLGGLGLDFSQLQGRNYVRSQLHGGENILSPDRFNP
jgi:hypothetical protein